MADIAEGYQRIVLAVDVANPQAALDLVKPLKGTVGAFKLGLEWITSALVGMVSPAIDLDEAVRLLSLQRQLIQEVGHNLMWDGKFDDIPATVAGASAALQPLSPLIFNVHASAGTEAVREAVSKRGQSWVFVVTVLTSIGEECVSIFGDKPGPKVVQFAHLIAEAGAQGIICSPKELQLLAEEDGLSGIKMLTPGVRPLWAPADDQKRVMTPQEAIQLGAWGVVVGRPISKPPTEIGGPEKAAMLIAEEIAAVL